MDKRRRAWTPEIVRERIKIGLLTKRLQDHALGHLEMTKTQITAAAILLKKAVPDLTSVEHSGNISHQHVSELSEAEILARLERIGAAEGAAESPTRPPLNS